MHWVDKKTIWLKHLAPKGHDHAFLVFCKGACRNHPITTKVDVDQDFAIGYKKWFTLEWLCENIWKKSFGLQDCNIWCRTIFKNPNQNSTSHLLYEFYKLQYIWYTHHIFTIVRSLDHKDHGKIFDQRYQNQGNNHMTEILVLKRWLLGYWFSW